MAWITKNSATMTIPRRDEPYLTDDIKSTIRDTIIPRYESNMGAILPALHEVQHHVGYLPYQALIEIAEFLDVPPQIILDTASFYDEFFLEPVGRYLIGICQSISCEACGHAKLIDHVRARLGIESGETTDDGLFTFRTMECLGSCDTAPCALFNEHRKDHLTVEQIDAFIDQIRSEKPANPA
jgi:NADH-quinone oxidoreductase subunit E